jgi:hypothetical protein
LPPFFNDVNLDLALDANAPPIKNTNGLTIADPNKLVSIGFPIINLISKYKYVNATRTQTEAE